MFINYAIMCMVFAEKMFSDTDRTQTCGSGCAALQEDNRMPRVAVITDSNSGITQMDGKTWESAYCPCLLP